jgi:hypothetical protein
MMEAQIQCHPQLQQHVMTILPYEPDCYSAVAGRLHKSLAPA